MRLRQSTRIKHHHLPQSDLACFTSGLIHQVVTGPFVFELQGNALAHHTDTVDRVDNSVNIVLLQQIALGEMDGHGYWFKKYQSGITTTGNVTPSD